MGRRSVSRILWSVRCLLRGHPSSYHRFFSHARWPLWPLAKVLAALVLELVPEDQPVLVLADDTVDQHRGDHVYGKGCHRDAVRSSWTRTVFKFGHKWVTLAISVRLPPRHKTPALLARQMIAVLMHSLPRPAVHSPGRLGLCQPRPGAVLPPPSPEAGGPHPFRHEPVRAAAGTTARPAGVPSAKGTQAAQPRPNRRRHDLPPPRPLALVRYAELAREGKIKVHGTPCCRKTDPTFADALAAVRRLLWEQVILPHTPGGECLAKLPSPLQEMLLEHVTAAA
jgi:hypothetical protein